jgi:hypothetical protein
LYDDAGLPFAMTGLVTDHVAPPLGYQQVNLSLAAVAENVAVDGLSCSATVSANIYDAFWGNFDRLHTGVLFEKYNVSSKRVQLIAVKGNK